ncbi:MAG: ATP-binding protein [Gammaproteobacteria bacterium]|nr:ATP-binding protein [Gammaproteobacteria bacterium]
MIYRRYLQDQIQSWLFKNKIVILYGPRQVGKTTLIKEILKEYGKEGRYFNCETLSAQAHFKTINPQLLKSFLGDYKIIVLDEAQRIENIGLLLKVLIDEYPNMQIIATGSSSFDLANKIIEPLTGRSITFLLYPLSAKEIKDQYDQFYVASYLEKFLIFGSYPEIFEASQEEAKVLLSNLSSNYLYRDILEFEQLKKSDLLLKLLQLLSLQIGSEVKCHELASALKTSSKTIERYIDLLEKAFVVFRLYAFSRNLRKEMTKSFKVYFYDLGIRNSIINNFNPLSLRSADDLGALWENFCIIERLKYNQARGYLANTYFWRTYDQKEIDYIEESGGKLHAFEFKWNSGAKVKKPKEFLAVYANSDFKSINSDNCWEFFT